MMLHLGYISFVSRFSHKCYEIKVNPNDHFIPLAHDSPSFVPPKIPQRDRAHEAIPSWKGLFNDQINEFLNSVHPPIHKNNPLIPSII
jgi:hypothetical protein